MASHKHSYQCFDGIVDDAHQKPPLPAGLHSSSRGFSHQEPIDIQGCYLCNEHKQAHDMGVEARGAQSSAWYHPHHLQHQQTHRRLTRPEETPVEHHHHLPHLPQRDKKKVVLVKNSDPSIRRTIVLHRSTLRSMGLFLDEVSEFMQYHIRKLYTLEGRKVRTLTLGANKCYIMAYIEFTVLS